MLRNLEVPEMIAIVVLVGFVGFNLFSGMVHGVLYTKRGKIYREESPKTFWFMYAVFTFLGGACGLGLLQSLR